MRIHQQLLAVAADGEPEDADGAAQGMLRAIVEDIKKNRSYRRDGVLVHGIKEEAYSFPKRFSVEKIKTRWEKFAEEKGIKRRKKSRLVWSEEAGKHVPRWGSGSVQNMKLRSGLLEVEQSVSRLKKEKKARVEKNRKNMLNNRKRTGC